jgi:putative solute:sodium symporter small subunit
LAAQGSVLIFLIITWVYALCVNAWERRTPTGNLPASHQSEDANNA